MSDPILQAQRNYWNSAFVEAKTIPTAQSHWLRILTRQSSVHLRGTVLEIGCGRGYDTRYLLDTGCHVTCLDLSWNALQQVATISPTLDLVNATLPNPLPFRAASFAFAVAGLSLHYFLWRDTRRIVQEIARVLKPNGTLIFRVNSTEDVLHGAGRGEEIEPNLFLYQGRYKRFFSETMCHDLFDDAWQMERLLPWIETRSESRKPTWMGIVHRRGN